MDAFLTATFSMVARDPEGRLGIAIASAVPAVGGYCPFIRPGVGAVATQSWVNPYLAFDILDRLERGEPTASALASALDGDDGRDLRQLGAVSASGDAAVWTGSSCTPAHGGIRGDGYTIQGNMLTDANVLAAMEDAFLADPGAELSERLLAALEAGDAAGGDKRGKQSAALLVYGAEAYADWDLRIDDHAHPVAELRRIHAVALGQLRPFHGSMAKRHGRTVPLAPADREMILKPPMQRGGAATAARQAELEILFAPILGEIEKLRTLDLTEVHPAVVFDPRIGLAPCGRDA